MSELEGSEAKEVGVVVAEGLLSHSPLSQRSAVFKMSLFFPRGATVCILSQTGAPSPELPPRQTNPATSRQMRHTVHTLNPEPRPVVLFWDGLIMTDPKHLISRGRKA